MASGKMKFFSLAGKSLITVGMVSAICIMPPAMAGDMISGAQLKDHVRSVLMSRGLDSRPVISDNRRFRACQSPLEVKPMFGGYKTVRLTCPDADGFKIAIRTQIDSFVEKIKTDIQDIKAIAYCVGSIDLKPLRMVSENDFNKCMKLNLYSAVDLIKGFQESLKKNKGSIVLFSTVAAQRGFTNHSIIASTKAAVEGLTVSLAAEFAPNIRVNCIAPSLTNSKIAEPMLKNKVLAEGIAKAHPLKRLGEGKDSASLAKFLITEDSSWVTGQIIAVDGGRSKLS